MERIGIKERLPDLFDGIKYFYEKLKELKEDNKYRGKCLIGDYTGWNDTIRLCIGETKEMGEKVPLRLTQTILEQII